MPRRREVHLILDNYGTHTHPRVNEWFAAHPRYHRHFVPTSSSWLNLVERRFADITRKQIRRGTQCPRNSFEPSCAISEHNDNPRPFVWTASAATILRKVRHCKEALDAAH